MTNSQGPALRCFVLSAGTDSCRGQCDSRSVSGIELLMEELVEVTVLMEGLMPYAG